MFQLHMLKDEQGSEIMTWVSEGLTLLLPAHVFGVPVSWSQKIQGRTKGLLRNPRSKKLQMG